MRLKLLLNREAGSLRGRDGNEAVAEVMTILRANGHEVRGETFAGPEAIAAIERSCEERETDVVVVGGGDGTISAAAGAVSKAGKTLGILPLGTMNLFARSLGIPLDLIAAAKALASAEKAFVD